MRTKFFWVALLLFGFAQLHGQTLKSSTRKAKAAFYKKDFSAAFEHAEKVLRKNHESVEALFIGGESARQLRKFQLAEYYLSQIPDKDKLGIFAVTDFNLGLCQKSLGNYDKAMATFRRFLEKRKGSNDLLTLHAANELESCKWALHHLEQTNFSNIRKAGENVSTAYSEYAPLRYADKLYFTAGVQENPGEPTVSRIFTVIQNAPAQSFSKNPERDDWHASHVAIMPDASRMYYTICHDEYYYQQNRCEIWSMDKTYEGDWAAPSKLEFPINVRGFTTTQPSIGWDKSLKKYVLYFVSDRPGGKGKLDIWGCAIDWQGNLSEPFCLSANTAGDDVTPFFHQASQTLFFSSDGRHGLGGFDIFQTKKSGNGSWSPPQNMGTPLNTSYDDLYYTWHTGSQRGYFSSNRNAMDCPEAPKGDLCTELFKAQIFMLLNIEVFDKSTDAPISDFTVDIASLGAEFQPVPNSTEVGVLLDIGMEYDITIMSEGYLAKHLRIDAKSFTNFTRLDEKVFLVPGERVKP